SADRLQARHHLVAPKPWTCRTNLDRWKTSQRGILSLSNAEAGRASRGDPGARARFCHQLQCQTTRGSIRVLRVARILAVVLPHLQLPALFEKARERGHADKDARSVAGRPSLWKRARQGSFKWIDSPSENAWAWKDTVLTA